MNIDNDVFRKLGRSLFMYNMFYSDDPDIKGDCRIVARGMVDAMEEEIKRQNASDLLQMLIQLGNNKTQGGIPFVPEGVLLEVIKRAVVASPGGVDAEEWDMMAKAGDKRALACQQQQAQQEQQFMDLILRNTLDQL